jgi:4-amino-4-deoxy-L-arabinose transferase-like glycosyltransferase
LTLTNVKIFDKHLLIIIVIAFIIRLLFMWLYPDQIFPDAQAYKTIGQEIFTGKIITNHIYMPLYPILSFVSGGGSFQILLDIIFSVLSIWLMYLTSAFIFKDRIAALSSAAIAAIYPHFVFYSVSGLTEVFYTFLLLLSIFLFYKKYIVLGIIISILGLLVKPSLDFLNPILVFMFVIFVHKMDWRKAFKYLGIYFISYIIIMSPWWIHQYQKYDSFVRLSLGDGVVLYTGNNPLNKSGGGINGVDVDETIFNQIDSPIDRNIAQKNEAIKYIIENPIQFVKMSGVKFKRFWRLWPYAEEYTQWYIIFISILSYGVVLLLSLGFLFRNSKKYVEKLSPIFALFVYLTLVHMITIGSIRYRFPLEPFLIIFAGYFFVDIIRDNKWFIDISANYLKKKEI